LFGDHLLPCGLYQLTYALLLGSLPGPFCLQASGLLLCCGCSLCCKPLLCCSVGSSGSGACGSCPCLRGGSITGSAVRVRLGLSLSERGGLGFFLPPLCSGACSSFLLPYQALAL
jgi:hypothetical protein